MLVGVFVDTPGERYSGQLDRGISRTGVYVLLSHLLVPWRWPRNVGGNVPANPLLEVVFWADTPSTNAAGQLSPLFGIESNPKRVASDFEMTPIV